MKAMLTLEARRALLELEARRVLLELGAREALLTQDKPLHVAELLKLMHDENSKKARVSLAGSLRNYCGRGEVFVKTGPNCYGLIEKEYAAPAGSSEAAQEKKG